jgi:PGF-CTERM protein
MRRELDETRGVARLRWLGGMAWVSGLGLVAPLVVAGVVFGVIGGAIANAGVFLDVYRNGDDSWIGALAFTVPTALVGLVAAALVLRRHRAAPMLAYAFAALVAVSAVISIANVTPVRPFLTDWQRVTTDPQAADHAQELRINSSIGAIAAAGALMFIARRRRRVVS